jgi:hypothetical protein
LKTDALDWVFSGVLLQVDDKEVLCLIVYFLLKYSAVECNYKIYNKELLAIIKSLEE